jgi:hypothetical protein
VRSGVIRTVSCTGGVITAAGLIFAASMFGLLFASITMMVQAGFVLGMGILLDTFLVRTVTVPAIAALVGRANWWPSRFREQVHTPVRRAATVPVRREERISATHHLTSDDYDHQTRVAVPPSVANRHRHGAHEAHEGLTPHALPLFGTTTVPEQLATNGLESAVEAEMAANRERPAQTDGQSPVETNGEQPVETNGQHLAETNGHEPVKTPPVAPSSEDDRVNEPRWIARWPTSDATFPVDAYDGMS